MGLQGQTYGARDKLVCYRSFFEAVTTTGDNNQMLTQYREDHDGDNPSGEEFDKMRETASQASSANYASNMAVLMGTKQIAIWKHVQVSSCF
jgi:hypothetical protein